jgi:peroxiredoxin
MALTSNNSSLAIGDKAPNFLLQDTVSGNYMSFQDVKSQKGTVVMFICNHCPYVIHVNQEVVNLANEYKSKGIAFVAISSNDVENYPDDAPDKMRIVAKVLKFPYPYLYDKRQTVAKEYAAECTPEFYVFDREDSLYYHGRLDDSRPGTDIPLTGKDLRYALDELLLENPSPKDQIPSVGCGIKWKA